MTSESRSRDHVAIIGMAVRLPEADDPAAFLANLSSGRDSVRALSGQRKARTSLPLDEEYQLAGYIEDIDEFDHAFFGVPKGEADNMAPQHRLLLQTAYHAIENAGYDPSALRGARGSVYVADTKVMYDELASTLEPTMVMGSHNSATAGRLSRFFGLRGPAAMVDTACSSGLTAVHLAVNDLLSGDAELALAGCASINLFADRLTGELDIGIRSPDGKARAFSADAAGTGSGEAVVVLVLRRLADAQRDGDPIQAVIKSVAANHVAGRSSTLTSPDSAAEAEVIELAWERAGIDPRTVTYIEAHGTATRLGDPIEIEAIDTAFARHTPDKGFCAVSSVKSNLGHTWSASGLVGIVKAVLSLRHRVLFPSLHTERLNPLIDFAGSAVTVTRRLTPWEPECGVRRAGVSAFGVMGTNVHAVLEEAPPPGQAEPAAAAATSPFWLPVSAKSPAALAANLAALRDWIDEHPDAALADVQRTLVQGRAHYRFRHCMVAAGLKELRAALESPSAGGEASSGLTVLVAASGPDAPLELAEALCAAYPAFETRYRDCLQAAEDPHSPVALGLAFQYAYIGLLRHIGLVFDHVVGEGAGKLALDAEAGRLSLREALCRAAGLAVGRPADLAARAERLLDRFSGRRVRFIEAGQLSEVGLAIAGHGAGGGRVLAVSGKADGFAGFLRELYLDGADWTWATTAGRGRRVELPGYRFEKVRCWIAKPRIATSTSAVTAHEAVVEGAFDARAAVREAWRSILGTDDFADDVPFFTLGGDSISALDVLAQLEDRLGMTIDQVAVFDYPTVRDLATYLDGLIAPADEPIAEHAVPATALPAEPGVGEPFPASAAQQQIWLAAQFEGGSVAFNLTRSFRLDGQLDENVLRRAADDLTGRHEALRAGFRFEDGQLLQRVARPGLRRAPIETLAVAGRRPGDAELAELCRPFAARPFDLSQGPLIRIQVLRFEDGGALLTLSTHHLVADGWSLDLLVRDLFEFYSAHAQGRAPVLPEQAIGYRECRLGEIREAQGRREAARRYWLDRFAVPPAPLDLPVLPTAGSAPAFRGGYRSYALPGQLWDRLKRFARDEATTPFGCLLTLFAALLAPYSEQGELALGTSLAGRGAPGTDQVVGMFVRTAPIRVSVAAGDTLRSLQATVRMALRDALANDAYPYEELVQELRGSSAAAAADLFQVLVEYEQFGGGDGVPFAAARGAGLRVEPVEVTLATSVFPLNVMLSEQPDGLAAVIRHDTRLFDDAAVDRLWTAFTDLAGILLDAPDKPMSSLPLLGGDEQERLRAHGTRSLEFDPRFGVIEAFERNAAEHPDRICLSSATGNLTYGQLNERAERLARYLREHCDVRRDDLVALVMDRSALIVETILAVWKCFAAYLPVDPAHPLAYVGKMLESAGPRLVVLDPERAADGLAAELMPRHQVIEGFPADLPAAAGEPAGAPGDPGSLAYVIFTSGSTGDPKGTMVTRGGMLNHLHAKIADLSLTERSVVAQNASSSFDISVWQMFAALFTGGRTVVVDHAAQLDPARFGRILEDEGITVLEVVPSHLDVLLEAWRGLDRPVRLRALEYLVVTGEAVHPRTVNRWLAAYPGVPVVNAYGPTEASDDITHHVMRRPVREGSVPIGRPVPNTRIYVLDEHSRLLPYGAVGEICVSGICVGRGYLNAPGQTERAFAEDPFQPNVRMYRTGDKGRWNPDGTLCFLGRSDAQVKVRGFRVDLGEIERRAASAPGIAAAAVVAPEGVRDRLSGYVVLEGDGSIPACRAHLARELPWYMVPADLVALPALPLTPNGKVDRLALRRRPLPAPAAPGAGGADCAASDSAPGGASGAATGGASGAQPPVVARVLDIWREVLGRQVGPHDRFFDAGGNSLRAIQVLSRMRDRLGVRISLEQLFERPTVAALVPLLDDAADAGEAAAQAREPLPAPGGPGRYPLAPAQHLLLRSERRYPARAAFNRNDLYQVHGPLDSALLGEAFAALARRHETLRTTFEPSEPGQSEAAQVIHAAGDLPLLMRVHDLRDETDPAAALERFVDCRIREPFDTATEPLVRADLLRTGERDHALLISMHQLVSDGRSAQVLHDELLAIYDELAAGRDPGALPIPVQYKEVAAWRAGRLKRRAAEHRAYWGAQLAGAGHSVPLVTDRPRPAITNLDGRRLTVDLPGPLADGIAALARRASATEFAVIRTAVGLLLCGRTGARDMIVGTYTRGRDRTELESGIGCYINTVPLRLRIGAQHDVLSLIEAAQRDNIAAFEHDEYPYERTMGDLGWRRGPEGTPLFDVMIAYDDECGDTEPVRTLRLEARELPRRAKEGDLLVVFARDDAGLRLMVTYDTHLFNEERIAGFADALAGVLGAMIQDRPVAQILREAREAP